MTETTVFVPTPDGACDAAFIHPTNGAYPGVIIWTDIFGLRPVLRGFGRRLAAEGYSVLIPNPFYRSAKAPVYDDIASFDFGSPEGKAKRQFLTGPLIAPGAAERDAIAHVAFLDLQKEVDKAKKIGTQGYCMGGPLAFKTAAAVPDRVGAVGTFHGGGLVTDAPDSPHLLAPRIKTHLYIAVAANDDMRQPDAKDKLRAAFAAAHVPAEIEVYPEAQHGWCIPDIPRQNSIARPMPSVPGTSYGRCTRRRWHKDRKVGLRPIATTSVCERSSARTATSGRPGSSGQ